MQKELALAKCKLQCDAEKKEKIEAANTAFDAKRRKHIQNKERRMDESKGRFRQALTSSNANRPLLGLQFNNAMLNDMTQLDQHNGTLNDSSQNEITGQ